MTDQDLRIDPADRDAVIMLNGGRPVMKGGERVLNFGLVPSPPSVTAANTVAVGEDDEWQIQGPKVFLWDYYKKANGGKMPAFKWQLTGSCVEAGGHNAANGRAMIEVATLGQGEVYKRPFTMACYGYSRKLLGDNSPGEGSSGDTFAQALRDVGCVPWDFPGLPTPRELGPAICYTEKIEYQFSAWPQVPEQLKTAGKPNNYQFGVCKTLDDCERELRKRRPISVAGNWGGRMKCDYKTDSQGNKFLWNADQVDNWEHQQSCHAVWRHPEFGRIWYIMNNWFVLQGSVAVSVHGVPMLGEPVGGYWTDDRMMQHQLSYRFGELRSFRDFSGYSGGLLNVLAA